MKLRNATQVLEGLQAASGFLRGELGRRLQMRRAPEVVFQLDRGLERGTSVLGLLNRLEDERQQRGEIPPGSDEQPGRDERLKACGAGWRNCWWCGPVVISATSSVATRSGNFRTANCSAAAGRCWWRDPAGGQRR